MGSNHKRQQITEGICFSSVEMMPDAKGSALFITDSSKVFKDDIDISPVSLTDGTQYMPWGGRRRKTSRDCGNPLSLSELGSLSVLVSASQSFLLPVLRAVSKTRFGVVGNKN